MSRKVDPKTVKVGDRVRVGRESDSDGNPIHGIAFGAVGTVVRVGTGWCEGDIEVEAYMPDPHSWSGPTQCVSTACCKVAK